MKIVIDDTLPLAQAQLIAEMFARSASLAAAHRGLPLANVEQPARRTSPHSIRIVDGNGRIGDRSALTASGREPGDLLSWRVVGGLVVINRRNFGKQGVWKSGYLSLPARAREAVGIGIGDRVLLATDLGLGLLVIYPAQVLDEILARRFTEEGGR